MVQSVSTARQQDGRELKKGGWGAAGCLTFPGAAPQLLRLHPELTATPGFQEG